MMEQLVKNSKLKLNVLNTKRDVQFTTPKSVLGKLPPG